MFKTARNAYRRWKMRRLRREAGRNRRRVAEFVVTRVPQSEGDFFAACMPDAPPEWLRWSSAIRWAIARFGRGHPRFVHADDRFSDLMALPNWCNRGDAFFDPVGLVMLIEDAVGRKFRDEEAERLPNVDTYDDLPVAEFLRKAVELCASKAATAPSPLRSRGRPDDLGGSISPPDGRWQGSNRG